MARLLKKRLTFAPLELHNFLKTILMRPFSLIFFSFLFANQILGQCEIFNLSANPYGCGLVDSFNVVVDFEYSNVGDNGFRILGNSIDHGTYDYTALPIHLGPFPANCATPWEYIVRDIDTNICTDNYVLGPICCPDTCGITELSIDPLFCIGDSSYMALLEFEFFGNLSDSFDIIMNDMFALRGAYAEEGSTFTLPSYGEIADEIVICDKGNIVCCDTLTIVSPCACIISNVTAELIGCNEDDGEFFVSIDCAYQNVADSFLLGGNNTNYGTYPFSDLPLLIGPLPLDSTDYEFVIFDQVDPFCFDVVQLGVMDDCILDCIISDIVLNPVDCNLDDIFLLEVSFTAEMPGPNGFSLYINDELVNSFDYGFSPYTIGPLVGDCEADYFVEIIDNAVPECTLSDLLVNYCCEDALCNTDFSILAAGISCTDSIVSADIDLDFDILPGTGIDIFIDGTYNSTHNFLTLPQEINFAWQGNQSYVMDICLEGLVDCCNTITLPAVNCGVDAVCDISEVEAQVLGCNPDGQFFASIFFEVFSPGMDGFVVQGNGTIYDTFNYGESPFVVGPLVGDCTTIYEFIVKDLADPDCSDFVVLDEVVCCDDGSCKLQDLEAFDFICAADNLVFDINFEVLNTSGQFDLFLDGDLKSTQAYTSLPLSIVNSDFNVENESFLVKVCDSDSLDCCAEIDIPFSAFGKPCTIDNLLFVTSDCEEGSFDITINWNCDGDPTYDITGNGMNYGVVSCNDLPFTLGPFDGDGETNFELIVTETNEGCSNSFEFLAENCTDVSTNDLNYLELNAFIFSNTIVFSKQEEIESFVLYDLTGRKLLHERGVQKRNKIGGLQDACYILQVNTIDGLSYSQIIYLSE